APKVTTPKPASRYGQRPRVGVVSTAARVTSMVWARPVELGLASMSVAAGSRTWTGGTGTAGARPLARADPAPSGAANRPAANSPADWKRSSGALASAR